MLPANLETFWSEGAIDSRIIVIDDPQRASSAFSPVPYPILFVSFSSTRFRY